MHSHSVPVKPCVPTDSCLACSAPLFVDVREQTIETDGNGEEQVQKEDDYKKILLGKVTRA